MAQGKYRKQITKKIRKGMKGYPIATVAFYGPTNATATKLVCGIIKTEDAAVEPMRKWFSEHDVRKSEKILSEAMVFIAENGARTVNMAEQILGCPHEEGIDYTEGEACPRCGFWERRDRYTHEKIQ